ncbi:hypothetical protein [Actinomadura sp. 6N118]|uniref:hypothetical protein n=1 Tax=Actinomadura sp. 6N118 TaxID=3375151 RepID=UPI00378F4E73
MIHKRYNHNGTPDLRRWLVECDTPGCGVTELMLSTMTAQWLISTRPGTRAYCPDCFFYEAANLIVWSIRCRNCGSSEMDFLRADDHDHPGPCCAACLDCTATLWSYTAEQLCSDLIDGWDIPEEWQP